MTSSANRAPTQVHGEREAQPQKGDGLQMTACRHCGRLACDDCDANSISGLELAVMYTIHVNDFAESVDRLHREAMA